MLTFNGFLSFNDLLLQSPLPFDGWTVLNPFFLSVEYVSVISSDPTTAGDGNHTDHEINGINTEHREGSSLDDD